MKIRNTLLIGYVISIILVIAFSFMVYQNYNKVVLEVEREEIADSIHTTVSELTILMNEYLAKRNDRSIDQWNSLYDEAADIIEVGGEDEFASIKSNFDDLRDLFYQLTTTYSDSELEERLVAQILIKSQAMIFDAKTIAGSSADEQIKSQEEANRAMIIGIIIIFIGLVILSFLVARLISKPITSLKNQVERITKGELDIELKKSRVFEVQSLTDSLNRILSSLKLAILRTGASKEQLGLEEATKAIEEAKKKAKESEEKFRDLVESTPDWIWEVDAKGVYTYASPKVKDLLGYSPEEIVGKTHFDLMPKEEAIKIGKIFEEIAKNKKPFSGLENWNIHKNGKKVLLETNGIPILNEKGNLIGYRGIDRDITEKKKAESDLRVKDQAIESSMSAIGMTDMNGKITYLNDALVKMWGYGDRLELMDKNLVDFFVGKKIYKTIQNLKKQGYDSGEDIGLKKGGYRFDVLFTANVIRDESGKPTAMLGSFMDITDMKRSEESLRESEQRFADVALSSGEWVWEINADGKILFSTGKLRELIGYGPDELLGKSMSVFMPRETGKEFNKKLSELVSEKKPMQDLRFEIISKKGKKMYFMANGVPLIDKNKNVYGYRGVNKNITEQKTMEDALFESHRQQQVIAQKLTINVSEKEKEIEGLKKRLRKKP